jgi:hypothetical protein
MTPAYPLVVQSRSGPGTCTGVGDYVIDDQGMEYRIISHAEANMIRNSTAEHVYALYPDGTIR